MRSVPSTRAVPGGCFFAHLLAEFDARDGPIHDEVVTIQHRAVGLLAALVTSAQQRGELNPETDPSQLAFEVYAPLELANYPATLHRDPAFLDRGRTAVRSAIARAAVPGASPE